MEIEIRDTRNGSWYWVNVAVNACPHITHAEKSVYGALASFGGCKDIHPSFLIIAKRSNTTPRLAMKAVKNMTKLGLINVEKGGGRGNANVYNLLKCPAGCVKCQNSEQINSEQINSEQINSVYKNKETVNKKTINSEQKDTPIDNEVDNRIHIAETAKWDFKEYLKGMENNKRRDLGIIALYWKFKKFNFTNKKQAEVELRRSLRAAKDLEPFEDEKIWRTMEWLSKNADFKWVLETVGKYINDKLSDLKIKK